MPVVAICPAHGPFASNAIKIIDSQNGYASGQEPCPQCGAPSRWAEGRFDFDAEGIATVISAPQWSQEALRTVQDGLLHAAHALSDETNCTAERAYGLLDRKLDQLIESSAATDAGVTDLVTEVKALERKLSRSRLATVLLGITAAIGMIADGGAVATMTGDTIRWVVEQVNAGDVSP